MNGTRWTNGALFNINMKIERALAARQQRKEDISSGTRPTPTRGHWATTHKALQCDISEARIYARYMHTLDGITELRDPHDPVERAMIKRRWREHQQQHTPQQTRSAHA